MTSQRAHFALSLGLVLLGASAAQATTVRPLSLDELLARADRVVLARVVASSPRWTADHQAILTASTVALEQSLKGPGQPGERLEVLREGGVVDGVGMRVQGAAELVVGEEVLLFLEQRGGSAWTVGMAQGKLRVETVGGRKVVSRDLRALAFVGERPLDASLPLSAPQPLEPLVREIVRRAGGAR